MSLQAMGNRSKANKFSPDCNGNYVRQFAKIWPQISLQTALGSPEIVFIL